MKEIKVIINEQKIFFKKIREKFYLQWFYDEQTSFVSSLTF